MHLVNLYCDMVIKPIDEERNSLIRKLRSKKVMDIMMRSLYQSYIDEYTEMLSECYKELGKMLRENHENRTKNSSIK